MVYGSYTIAQPWYNALYHGWEPLMWLTTSKAFYYKSRGKKEHNIAQAEALQVLERPKAPPTTQKLYKSWRDLKRHPPPLDLHAFYRLHLKSLLVVILHVYDIVSPEISYEYNHHSTSQLNYGLLWYIGFTRECNLINHEAKPSWFIRLLERNYNERNYNL